MSIPIGIATLNLDRSFLPAGTLKLAGDMAQLELALAPIQPLKDLGGPYKELRALRPLIFRYATFLLPSVFCRIKKNSSSLWTA